MTLLATLLLVLLAGCSHYDRIFRGDFDCDNKFICTVGERVKYQDGIYVVVWCDHARKEIKERKLQWHGFW